jgi:hypothetical protein
MYLAERNSFSWQKKKKSFKSSKCLGQALGLLFHDNKSVSAPKAAQPWAANARTLTRRFTGR